MGGSGLISHQETDFKKESKGLSLKENEEVKYLDVERATEATPESWGAQFYNCTGQPWNQTVSLGGDHKPQKSQVEPTPVSLTFLGT